MKKMVVKKAVVALLLSGLVANANATIYTTLFTNASTLDTSAGGNAGLNLLGGAPTGTFATLTYNSVSNVFTLNAATNLDSFFGTNTYIDAIAFKINQDRSELNDTSVSGGGITDFAESTSNLPDFGAGTEDDFNILYRTDNGATLIQGETVTFTITGLNPNCFTSATCAQNSTLLPATTFAIRLTNNPPGNNNTAISWASGYSIDPALAVPEPENFALFLAGLGLLAFVSPRHQRKLKA